MVGGIDPVDVRKVLEALPGRVDLTGKDFGVYRYKHDKHDVEIALPRRERSTGEGHQDFDVQADHTMPVEEDLKRRDFTANAMAVDLDSGELIDPFGGAEDLNNGALRTVTPESFKEDPLRIVRALVAHSRHGLDPHPEAHEQMATHADGLVHLPAERIQAELDKIFSSQDPAKAIRLAHDAGVLKHIFPEVEAAWDFDQNNPHHNHPLGVHLTNVLEHASRATDDPDVRLAALLHDIGKPASEWRDSNTGKSHYYRGPNGEGNDHETVGAEQARERLRQLKYPRARTERIGTLIDHHMYDAFSSPKGARKFLNRVGEHADDLMTLRHADMYGKGTDEYQNLKTPVGQMKKLVGDVRDAGQATTQSDLVINGNDLIAMGIEPGPELGEILNNLTQKIVESPELNTRDQLLGLVRGDV
jgi:tRNA nucleotidyltransferase (CCA-adding enzyme)